MTADEGRAAVDQAVVRHGLRISLALYQRVIREITEIEDREM